MEQVCEALVSRLKAHREARLLIFTSCSTRLCGLLAGGNSVGNLRGIVLTLVNLLLHSNSNFAQDNDVEEPGGCVALDALRLLAKMSDGLLSKCPSDA